MAHVMRSIAPHVQVDEPVDTPAEEESTPSASTAAASGSLSNAAFAAMASAAAPAVEAYPPPFEDDGQAESGKCYADTQTYKHTFAYILQRACMHAHRYQHI